MKIIPVRTGSSGNFYVLITSNNNNYLIECGISKTDITKALWELGYSISDFQACFISHSHSDHCASIKWVAKYMPIFSNSQVKEKFHNLVNLEVLTPTKKYEIKDLKVIPFPLEHGNSENYGYMFKDDVDTILFMTDFSTCYCNIFNNIFNEIFIECNWNRELIEGYENELKENRQINTHCSCDITKYCLLKLNLDNCRNITLIHSSDSYCDKEMSLNQLRKALPGKNIEFAKNLI